MILKIKHIKVILTAFTVLFAFTIKAQEVNGSFKQYPLQSIKLLGFEGLKPFALDSTTTDALGEFTLKYPANYKGMGVLQWGAKESLVLVMNEKVIKLEANNLSASVSVQFLQSTENKYLQSYAQQHSKRQEAWPAWHHLEKTYSENDNLSKQQDIITVIQQEKERLLQADKEYVNALPKESYAKWFIPMRQLVYDMPQSARYYPNRIPENIAQFRSIDFTHPNFKTSGLLKDLLEGHYMLLENMGQPLDSIYQQMNLSSDYLIENLMPNEQNLNLIGNHLFNYLESRSLFTASAHLAVQLLAQNSCELEDKLINKLEAYRKMKVGNIAPDILFSDGNKLSNGQQKYTLVVFGSSECPACKEAFPKLQAYKENWEKKGVAILYISLDTQQNLFKAPLWATHSSCDLKGWDGQPAKKYHVFATPTYFLLDNNRRILVRPNSPAHANAWVTQMLHE